MDDPIVQALQTILQAEAALEQHKALPQGEKWEPETVARLLGSLDALVSMASANLQKAVDQGA